MTKMRLLSVVLMATLPLWAGVTYEAETKTTIEGQKPQKTVVRAFVDGDKARIEFLDTNNPTLKSGGWILTEDGGKTMVMVNPKDKTYMPWNVAQLVSMLGSMGDMLNFKFSNSKTEMLEESAGDAIHGKSTHRYKYRVSYDLEMKILGMTQNQHVDTVQESWCTTAFGDLGMGAWLRSAPVTGIEGLDKMVSESAKQIKGFPLRSRTNTVTTQLDKKGNKKRDQNSVTEMNVTKLEEGSVDASKFKIPADYKKVEIPEGGQNGAPSFKDLFKRD